MFRGCSGAVLLTVLIASFALASITTLTVERVDGEVQVRHGVEERWETVTAGITLRPEDTIKTGLNAAALLRRDDGSIYRVPAETVIDVSDFRGMDRDELLLRLAMEDMLSVPDRIDDDRPVPRTTVLHGSPRSRVDEDAPAADLTLAKFRVNGARFLIEQNYRGTAVLKIRETLRLYPDGEYRIGAMMLAAESLESMELFEEAARYYKTVLDEDADPGTKRTAETRLERIKDR